MKQKPLLLIIPCYREAKNLTRNLPKVFRYLDEQKISCDVLVVEGDKLDDTESIVKEFKRKHPNLHHTLTHNGKGHQVKIGLQHGNYKRYLFMDADLATPLKYIQAFLETAGLNPEAGLITGIRTQRHGNPLRKMVSIVFNLLLTVFLGFRQTDTQCGFKLLSFDMRNVVIKKQTNLDWIFDVEYFIIAKQNNYETIAIPLPDWENDYERATLNTVPKFIKGTLSSGMQLLGIIVRAWTGWYKTRVNIENRGVKL